MSRQQKQKIRWLPMMVEKIYYSTKNTENRNWLDPHRRKLENLLVKNHTSTIWDALRQDYKRGMNEISTS
jgi:hypothetical protein